jgi:hypothetical protein
MHHNPPWNWHTFDAVSLVRPSTSRPPTVGTEIAWSTGVLVVVGAGDPGSSRLVYAMVIGLLLVGIAFVGLAVWLIRQTRYDPPVLAPLERMGDRDWRRQSDPATQRRILDEVRPDGARRSESAPPSLDAEFELPERPVTSMSDLIPLDDLAPPELQTRSTTPKGIDRPDLLDIDEVPAEEPVEDSAEEPVEDSAEEPVEDSAEEPVEDSAEEPVEDSTEDAER